MGTFITRLTLFELLGADPVPAPDEEAARQVPITSS
jgi:hypothetical protein